MNYKYTYDFKNFQTTNTFDRDIYNVKITLKEADEDQSSFLVENINFKSKIKPKNPEKKQKKEDVLRNLYTLFEGRERVVNAVIAKYFQ